MFKGTLLIKLCVCFRIFIFFYFNTLKGTLDSKENVVESKRDVDNQLKKSCETFIEYVCNELFGSVRELVKNVK